MYYVIINLALMSNSWTRNMYEGLHFSDNVIKILEVKPTDVKVITAIILAVILWNELIQKTKKGKKKVKLIEKGEAN